VEPDLPTDYFPTETVVAPGVPVEEGLDNFPPGCWADSEPALDGNPRWPLERMRVPQAWAFSVARGRPSHGAGIIVAQPDTGVTAHDELAGVIRAGGFNTITGTADPVDRLTGGNNGHGTGTASVLISPETPTIIGTAPRASHMPIRAIESVVRITQGSVARAIDWAVEHGAHVITMSLGGVPSFALHRALRRAVAADVIVLAAAGNCVRTVVWPARYDECLAVGGSTSGDGMWMGSCRGSAVDIAAPAQNVRRASAPAGASPGQGTSFAVAMTAGVAALWLAHHGRANVIGAARVRGETVAEMFRRLLQATSRRPAVWFPRDLGPGIVDAAALLAADFDLGRGTESVPAPADRHESAAMSVASLVAEVAGPAAATEDALDWRRYGSELATTLLASGRQTAEALPETLLETPAEPPAVPVVSAPLASAVTNPVLRDALGLDQELNPEVGVS
jgi:serine protease